MEDISKDDYRKYFPCAARPNWHPFQSLTPEQRVGLRYLAIGLTSPVFKSASDKEAVAITILNGMNGPSFIDAYDFFADKREIAKLENKLNSLLNLPKLLEWATIKIALSKKTSSVALDSLENLREQCEPLKDVDESDLKSIIRSLKASSRSKGKKRGRKQKIREAEIIIRLRNFFCQLKKTSDKRCEAKLIQTIVTRFGIKIQLSNLLRIIRGHDIQDYNAPPFPINSRR
jgi:hypothetical protein